MRQILLLYSMQNSVQISLTSFCRCHYTIGQNLSWSQKGIGLYCTLYNYLVCKNYCLIGILNQGHFWDPLDLPYWWVAQFTWNPFKTVIHLLFHSGMVLSTWKLENQIWWIFDWTKYEILVLDVILGIESDSCVVFLIFRTFGTQKSDISKNKIPNLILRFPSQKLSSLSSIIGTWRF